MDFDRPPPARRAQAALAKILIFGRLEPHIQHKVVSEMYEKNVAAGEILIKEGDTGYAASQLYVVKSGKFEVGFAGGAGGAWSCRTQAAVHGRGRRRVGAGGGWAPAPSRARPGAPHRGLAARVEAVVTGQLPGPPPRRRAPSPGPAGPAAPARAAPLRARAHTPRLPPAPPHPRPQVLQMRQGVNMRVNLKERGDCFGEVSLMYSCPRNATVAATTDAVVWVLERDVFR
jgi:CRP-like cAMP-binding protein